jgi:rhodanese-related sulfurtransferase
VPASIRHEVRVRPPAALRLLLPVCGHHLAIPLAAFALAAITAVSAVHAEPTHAVKQAPGETAQTQTLKEQDARQPASRSPRLSPALSSATPISTRAMLSRLEQPWVQLIDVRTPDEYSGRDIRALRGGHIPGAINVPLHEHVQPGASTTDHGSLGQRVSGLDARKETIVYGRDAQQARQAAERLRELGFRDLRVYLEAWQVWGNTLELPVAAERFADVAALRAQLDELQHRVAQLERHGTAAVPVDASAHSAGEGFPASPRPAWEQLVSSRPSPAGGRTVVSR